MTEQKQNYNVDTNSLPGQWRALAEPFPNSAYKDVKVGRGFTTIDAYHIIERLTAIFGMCGQGWGVQNVRYETHDDNVAAIGELWYRATPFDENPDVAVVHAVGDAKVIKNNYAEAYKKAQTNLISKAASFLGVGIGVYQGKGIDDPYLDRAREEGKPVAPTVGPSDEDIERIRKAREKAGLSKDDVKTMMFQSPFVCTNPPYDLLPNHVQTLIDRIEKAGKAAKGEEPDDIPYEFDTQKPSKKGQSK